MSYSADSGCWYVSYKLHDRVTGTKWDKTYTFDKGGENKPPSAIFDELIERLQGAITAGKAI